jgi:hypothetical protein
VPAPVAEQPFRTIIPRLNLLLRELDRRNRPAPGMAADGNSQAVVLVFGGTGSGSIWSICLKVFQASCVFSDYGAAISSLVVP